MDIKKYIDSINEILKSESGSIEKVRKISELDYDKDSAMCALISGEAQKIRFQENYLKNHEPDNLTNEDIKEELVGIADNFFLKLEQYLEDWNRGIVYTYAFKVIATYGHFVDGTPTVEYTKVEKNLDLEKLSDALLAAKKWDTELGERNEQGFKKISVYLHFKVTNDTNGGVVAAGMVTDPEKPIISTWLNQL